MLTLYTDVQTCNELKSWFLPDGALSISKSRKLGFVSVMLGTPVAPHHNPFHKSLYMTSLLHGLRYPTSMR